MIWKVHLIIRSVLIFVELVSWVILIFIALLNYYCSSISCSISSWSQRSWLRCLWSMWHHFLRLFAWIFIIHFLIIINWLNRFSRLFWLFFLTTLSILLSILVSFPTVWIARIFFLGLFLLISLITFFYFICIKYVLIRIGHFLLKLFDEILDLSFGTFFQLNYW